MNKYIVVVEWDKEPDFKFIQSLSWCGFKQINDNMFVTRSNGIQSVLQFKSLIKMDMDTSEKDVKFRNIYLINTNEYAHIKGLDYMRQKDNSYSIKFDMYHYKENLTDGNIVLKVVNLIVLQTTARKNKIIQYSLPDFNYLTINFNECDEIMSGYDFIKLSQKEIVDMYKKYCMSTDVFEDDDSIKLREKLLETFELLETSAIIGQIPADMVDKLEEEK